jgi:cell division protein FtsI (penicillin-binding protein 3)
MKPENIAADTTRHLPFSPPAKSGNFDALQKVMNTMNLKYAGSQSKWVKTSADNNAIKIANLQVTKNTVPDLTGLGARDAMYLLGKMGMIVQIQGRGKVISQNIKAGTVARKGQIILLQLEN